MDDAANTQDTPELRAAALVLLPLGNGPQSSTPFVLFDGDTASIFVSCSMHTDAYCVWIERQRADNTWQRLAPVYSHNGVVLQAAGTWRVTRDQQAQGIMLGVERGTP